MSAGLRPPRPHRAVPQAPWGTPHRTSTLYRNQNQSKDTLRRDAACGQAGRDTGRDRADVPHSVSLKLPASRPALISPPRVHPCDEGIHSARRRPVLSHAFRGTASRGACTRAPTPRNSTDDSAGYQCRPGFPQDAAEVCAYRVPQGPAQSPAQRGVTCASAGTRYISPPKKAKSMLVLFFPFTSRILTGLKAVRAADAARVANSTSRHMQERVTYPTFVLLESSSIYPSVHSTKHRSNPLKLPPDSSIDIQAV
ncbi:uncharacterized protein LOC120324281 [Pipra filicauda]|uniref:Uncharacterized protein LOC120324281 n=1 Tax=Pipra filicauda TaxID=649802 RepID=A0A7R5KNV2_9PASS|nr:uncharacterized protein LOC120324281 [Pipra filicauda]